MIIRASMTAAAEATTATLRSSPHPSWNNCVANHRWASTVTGRPQYQKRRPSSSQSWCGPQRRLLAVSSSGSLRNNFSSSSGSHIDITATGAPSTTKSFNGPPVVHIKRCFGTERNSRLACPPQSPQQQQQYSPSSGMLHRTMVTVTKTKVSSMPSSPNENDDEEQFSPSSTNGIATGHSGAVGRSYVTLPNSLQVTAGCLDRIEALIQQRRNKLGDTDDSMYFLRVFVDAGGCSGFQYQFEMDTELDDEDDVVVVAAEAMAGSDGTTIVTATSPRVVTDGASLPFLEGSTLDYVVEMIKASFVVRDNPNSESACGCGSSFAVKNFSANPALD